MSENTKFDDRRSAAWREAVVETARSGRYRDSSRRRRASLVVVLVIAVLAVSGGGVAYALAARVLLPAGVPTSTATPIERDTPRVTSSPSPSATQDPADVARGDAQQACQLMLSALDSNGNVTSSESWATALASASRTAETAAALDPSRATFAAHVATLSQTPLPGPSATDPQKNAFTDVYLPVADDCWASGVHLPTD